MESRKMGRTSWTDETQETLIELWREHPCLYDVSHQFYQNRDQKEESWREVAALLDKPVEDVKTRALSLRTMYSRLVKPKPRGRANQALTTKQRWILRTMEFIRPHIIHRPCETEVTIMFDDTQETKNNHELEKEIRKEKEKRHRPLTVSNLSSLERKLDKEVAVQVSPKPPKTLTLTPTPTPTPTPIPDKPVPNPAPHPAEPVSSKHRDEDELFLLSLLPSIRRLTNKKKMEVRMKFQQVLYAAEFEDGV